MKKHIATLAISVLFLGITSSVSIAGSFDGPFMQVGIGFANAQNKVTTNWPDLNIDSTATESGFIGQIAGGYSQSWSQFYLAASAYYVIGDQKAGSIHMSTPPPPTAYGVNTYDFKNTNTWGITIDPGINLNDSTTVYLKLGYGQTSAKGTEHWQNETDIYDKTYSGFSYGAGVKYRLTPNIYGMAEILQTNYDSSTFNFPDPNGGSISFKPSSLIGTVGVGYKF
jgi:opacity protein-like surface antigen